MTTLTLTRGQISPIIEIGKGTRVTSSGNGTIEYYPGALADAKNGGTFEAWPKGTSAGSVDAIRSMCIRATATGAMTVTLEEGKNDLSADGAYWDSEYATFSTDANNNTVLVGAGGNEYRVGHIGEFFAKLGATTTVPTGVGTPVHLQFSDVIVDTLGIYDSATHLIGIPDDIVKIDCEYGIEMKNDAAATAGTVRGFTMNNNIGGAIIGLAALSCTKVGMVGGAYGRCCFDVRMPIADYVGDGRKIKPQFRHDAGVDLVVGDSSGTGVAQTFIKIRLYRV